MDQTLSLQEKLENTHQQLANLSFSTHTTQKHTYIHIHTHTTPINGWDINPPKFILTKPTRTSPSPSPKTDRFHFKRTRMHLSSQKMQEHGRLKAISFSNPQTRLTFTLFLHIQSYFHFCPFSLRQHGLCMLNLPPNRLPKFVSIQHHDKRPH